MNLVHLKSAEMSQMTQADQVVNQERGSTTPIGVKMPLYYII